MTNKKRFVLRLQEGNVTCEAGQKEQGDEFSRIQFYRTVGMASELGFLIAFPIVGGIVAGTWLDKKFSTYPRLTLSLLIFGVIISFANLFYVMREYLKKSK